MSELLSDVRKFIDGSPCPFAAESHIVIADIEPQSDTFEEMAWHVSERMRYYLRDEQSTSPDGLFVVMPTHLFGEGIEGLAEGVRRLFLCLENRDTQELIQSPLETRWRLVVDDTEFAPLVFSPLYAPDNPRYLPIADKIIIYFQPQASFDSTIPVPSDTVAREKLYRIIQLKFKRAGQEYNKPKQGANRVLFALNALSTDETDYARWYLTTIVTSEEDDHTNDQPNS